MQLGWAAILGLAFAAAWLVGCTPHVGDHCNENSDCSLQGTLQCDTSQPNGYCTLFNCSGNSCPNNAACIALNAAVPGCQYNEYLAPSRTSLPMCLWICNKDSDCRTSEGYVCRDPTAAPWDAVILDDDQVRKVCVVEPSFSGGPFNEPDGVAPVCSAAGPVIDGSVFPAQDAAVPGVDASEGGPGDAAGSDGAGADGSGAADAPSGG